MAAVPADSSGGSAPSAWKVTFTGLGPVRAGMTVPEAARALNDTLVPRGDQSEPCRYLYLDGKSDVALLIFDDVVARVDIQGGPYRTSEGAGIGDTEERIRSIYGTRVEVRPHRYTDGHYLIVRKGVAADSNFRIVFETDGREVTVFRSGRMPEVEWVEGCS